MSLAIDVLEPSALLIVCQVLDGALLTRLRGVKPGIGSAANVRFCLARRGRKAGIRILEPRPSGPAPEPVKTEVYDSFKVSVRNIIGIHRAISH